MSEAVVHDIAQALDAVKAGAKEKFDATVEIHMRLGIDPKRGEEQVRGVISFPHSFGKSKKIVAFTSDTAGALAAGATKAGGAELVKEIKDSGKCDFEVVVAEPAFMKELAPISKILGPKGLMPSPKNETVTTNVAKTVMEILKGKIAFKNDETGNLHFAFGKVSFSPDQLATNYKQAIDVVKKMRPQGLKGTYVKSITIASSMGKGVRVKVV